MPTRSVPWCQLTRCRALYLHYFPTAPSLPVYSWDITHACRSRMFYVGATVLRARTTLALSQNVLSEPLIWSLALAQEFVPQQQPMHVRHAWLGYVITWPR